MANITGAIDCFDIYIKPNQFVSENNKTREELIVRDALNLFLHYKPSNF